MQQGRFYFIHDNFFEKHDKNKQLMQNKEIENGTAKNRPCFFAFSDNSNPNVFWCVPVSSKVAKYRDIYDRKIKSQIDRNVPNPKCNTIRFGNVMGLERAFLIQNMFPVTADYIISVYIDKNTNNEVTISPDIEKDIIKNAKEVLRLVKRGVPILFADVMSIFNSLEND